METLELMETLEPLSDAAMRAVKAERDAPVPVDSAMELRLAASFAALAVTPPAVPAPAVSPAGALASKVVIGLAALGVGVAGGWVARGAQPPQIIERVVRVEVSVAPPVMVSDAPAPVVPSPSKVVRLTPPVPVVPSAAERDALLARERSLVDMARSALVQRHPQEALNAVEEHERAFTTPALAEERESVRVRALLQLGRVDEARARVTSFEKQWPDSLLLPALKAGGASP